MNCAPFLSGVFNSFPKILEWDKALTRQLRQEFLFSYSSLHMIRNQDGFNIRTIRTNGFTLELNKILPILPVNVLLTEDLIPSHDHTGISHWLHAPECKELRCNLIKLPSHCVPERFSELSIAQVMA